MSEGLMQTTLASWSAICSLLRCLLLICKRSQQFMQICKYSVVDTSPPFHGQDLIHSRKSMSLECRHPVQNLIDFAQRFEGTWGKGGMLAPTKKWPSAVKAQLATSACHRCPKAQCSMTLRIVLSMASMIARLTLSCTCQTAYKAQPPQRHG